MEEEKKETKEVKPKKKHIAVKIVSGALLVSLLASSASFIVKDRKYVKVAPTKIEEYMKNDDETYKNVESDISYICNCIYVSNEIDKIYKEYKDILPNLDDISYKLTKEDGAYQSITVKDLTNLKNKINNLETIENYDEKMKAVMEVMNLSGKVNYSLLFNSYPLLLNDYKNIILDDTQNITGINSENLKITEDNKIERIGSTELDPNYYISPNGIVFNHAFMIINNMETNNSKYQEFLNSSSTELYINEEKENKKKTICEKNSDTLKVNVPSSIKNNIKHCMEYLTYCISSRNINLKDGATIKYSPIPQVKSLKQK